MDSNNAKSDAADTTTFSDAEQNPSNNPPTGEDGEANRRRRTRFTDFNQVDADLALARRLQEQERAYMMLRIGAGSSGHYRSWDAESYGHEDEIYDDDFDDASVEDYNDSDEEDETEDAFDVHAHGGEVENANQNRELNPSLYSSDEAYARALQDAEEREVAARLFVLSGMSEMVVGEDGSEGEDENDDEEERGGNSLDTWEDVDPDELSYEELSALCEVVGTESRGLSADTIASLPSIDYKSQDTREGSSDCCVICRLDYEDGDTLTLLSCKHSYHAECINNWLQINKVCPVCCAEVSTTSGKI